MEFWFLDYDKESFERPFLKVDYMKYLNRALTSLPFEELGSSLELSENKVERLLQDHLLEQNSLMITYFDELNAQIDDHKYNFKEFIRITSLFLQLEKLYFHQYWEFDVLKDFILNRLFASFVRFFKFLQSFLNSICASRLRFAEDSQQIDKIFASSISDLAKTQELLLKFEDLLPFQQYLQVSLETLCKSLERTVSTAALSKEKLFLSELAYISKLLLQQDPRFLWQDCKSRFFDSESFVIIRILQENDAHLLKIREMQQELEITENQRTFDSAEKELVGADPHFIDGLLENLLEQYNPSSKKYANSEENAQNNEKNFSRQPTGSGSSNTRESLMDVALVGSQKNLASSGANANAKNRKTFLKVNDLETQRKTLLSQEENYKKSKNSSYALNLFQNSLTSTKKNSRIDPSLKLKAFGLQRTTSNVNSANREKSDSITETPKEAANNSAVSRKNPQNLNALQPQIDFQKNLTSALEADRYKNSPNFVKNSYENPLLRYVELSACTNQQFPEDFAGNASLFASFGRLDRAGTQSPKKTLNELDKRELFSQMNEKLSENLLTFLVNSGNLAEIKPEEIKFERTEERVDEVSLRKGKKGKKFQENGGAQKTEDESKQSLQTKNLTLEEKEPAFPEENKKKKENFFSRHKNQKKGEKKAQKVKKVDEKDFIKIDGNTEIKGKLEYVEIEEHSAEDIKDYELFDLNYKSEEENLKVFNKNDEFFSLKNDTSFTKFFEKLQREEYVYFLKSFTPNNPKNWWKKLRNSLSSDFNLHMVSKILGEKKVQDIKRRDFDFKKKHKLIACNILGQNMYS